nr:YbaN family protein [Variovorax boronicumulans]
MAFAALCLVLAAIGVVAPGMPTTVFVLMAAWAAARSSPRLHRWLLNHRLFGPLLRNWENGRTVSRRAKWSATAAMAFCAVVILLTAHKPWLAGVAIGSMAVVLAWLWRRPEPPQGG